MLPSAWKTVGWFHLSEETNGSGRKKKALPRKRREKTKGKKIWEEKTLPLQRVFFF